MTCPISLAGRVQLYDLMAMVFKYQAEQCSHPRQLLMVTLNHLDSMARFATAPRVRKQVHTAHELAVQVRRRVGRGCWLLVLVVFGC